MDIQSYRHIAIAIGRYWCRGWQPINLDQRVDSDTVEDVLDTAVDKMWDVTASHGGRVANNAYAMNMAVAMYMQPRNTVYFSFGSIQTWSKAG